MSETTSVPSLLTAKQAASILAIGERSLFRLIASTPPAIPFIRIGRCLRFDPADVAAFINRQRTGGNLAC